MPFLDLARIVVAGLPHHATQRGNRGERVFFSDQDYALYRDLLAERCRKADVRCWAYCLTPNHVHLILVPATADGLARALGETHRATEPSSMPAPDKPAICSSRGSGPS